MAVPAGGEGETKVPQTPPCPGGVARATPLRSPTPRAAMSRRPVCTQPPLDPPHHSSPFLAAYPHSRHPFHLPDLGASLCSSPALSYPHRRHSLVLTLGTPMYPPSAPRPSLTTALTTPSSLTPLLNPTTLAPTHR